MGQLRLYPSSRPFEADWLAPRRAPFGSYCVASMVPGGFAAYVRMLHPATGSHGGRLRWAEVALKSGSTMHRLAQFHAINRPSVSGSEIAATPPERGSLPPDLLRAACNALAEHTSTPDQCWFCLWNGYGWLRHTATSVIEARPSGLFAAPVSTFSDTTDSASRSHHVPADWLNAARVHLPHRDYFLFEGPLEAAS